MVSNTISSLLLLPPVLNRTTGEGRSQIKQYSRNLPHSQQLSLPHLRNLPRIEFLPRVILDQSNTLQDLRGEADTLVCDLDHLLALGEHDLDEDKLDGEAEDEDAQANKSGIADLYEGKGSKREKVSWSGRGMEIRTLPMRRPMPMAIFRQANISLHYLIFVFHS